MTDIILTTKGLSLSAALRELDESQNSVLQDTQCLQPSRLHPYTPYSLSLAEETANPADAHLRTKIMTRLSEKGLAKAIADPLMTLGPDNFAALAEIMEGLEAATVNGTGATVSMTADRTRGLAATVSRYQQAVLHYHKLSSTKGAAPGKVAHARIEVIRHFGDLQRKFQPELQTIKNRKMLSKRSPLHDLNRGLNIAKDNRSNRAVAKLSVANHVEGTQLIRFGQYATALGTGLVAIDIGTRIGNVQTEYLSGDDWSRELFRESLSFALSTGFAYIGSQIGAAVLLPILAPFGWVFLIIGGALLAGGLTAGSMAIDKYVKKQSYNWYDSTRGLF